MICLAMAILLGPAAQCADKANSLVSFLVGDWDNVSFEIADNKPIKKEAYSESMRLKDRDTLTITAHAFREGQDLTREMTLEVRGKHARMKQGDFSACGRRVNNLYCLEGKEKGKIYRFRLYTLGDKYVFIREICNERRVEKVDLSYLTRKNN